MKENQFMDMTYEEFADSHLGHSQAPSAKQGQYIVGVESLPKSVDWREKGGLTPIKNQEQCGSCWAFATIATLETLNFNVNGKLEAFSEQSLMDCANTQYTNGCNGGNFVAALDWTERNGVVAETEDPYLGRQSYCDQYEGEFYNKGFEIIPQGSPKQLQIALTNNTVAVGIYATRDLMLYGGGIFNTDDCDPRRINHAVTVVGYGTDEETGEDYWLLRNSWSTHFGEEGYFRFPRSSEEGPGPCGML